MKSGSSPRFFSTPGRLGELQALASAGGDLVFTAGMTGHHAVTGAVVSTLAEVPGPLAQKVASGMVISDVPESRILAQTLVALEHAGRALEAAGSSLALLVRLRLFLRDMRDAASAAHAVKTVLGAQTPATTIVEATGPGVDPEVDVVLDAIGASRQAARAPRHVFVDGLLGVPSEFPAATVFGYYVFTAPVSAARASTVPAIAIRENLSATEKELLDDTYYDPRSEALAIEQVLMWRDVRRILAATDVAFENILHQSNWLAISMQQYAPVTRVRSRLFGIAGGRTAATSLPISALRVPDAAFECSVIGVTSGQGSDHVEKEVRLGSHMVGPYYVGAVKAGPCVFAAGEVPVHATGEGVPVVVTRATDLIDELKRLNAGRVHREYPVMAQAHFVYELIAHALSHYGCGLRDVLHQSVYLVEPAHFPVVERIATLHYGVSLPPTTLVPIRGASPFKQTLLEIEVTALATT